MRTESSPLLGLEALSLEDPAPTEVSSTNGKAGTPTADGEKAADSDGDIPKAASTRPFGGFPTEIIEMILQHVCLPAAPPFYSQTNYDMSSIKGLLEASRNFYAVLSPLVYPLRFKHVVIERPSQLASLHNALSTKPWLRPLVKRIVIGREKGSLYSSHHDPCWPVPCYRSENSMLRDAAANNAQASALDPYSWSGIIGLLRSVLEMTRGAHVRVTVNGLQSSVEKRWNRHLVLVREDNAKTRTPYWLPYHLVDREEENKKKTDAHKKLEEIVEKMKDKEKKGGKRKKKGRRGKFS